MKFDKALEYQKIDLALAKIERTLGQSGEKEKAATLNSKIKNAAESMQKFNMEADELMANAEKLTAQIAEYEEEANEIAEHIGEVADFNEIEYYEKLLFNLSEDVQKLERELIKINNRIDSVKEGSDSLTRQAYQLNEQYKVAMKEYQDLKGKLQDEARPIMQQLNALEKELEPALVVAYKRCRNLKKLPAIVEYQGDGSCFCGMNLPNDCIGKLKNDGDHVECPNCGRIVVLNK